MTDLQKSIEYIRELAKTLHVCFEDENYLFEYINGLQESEVSELLSDYDGTKLYTNGKIAPINLLRNKLLTLLLAGEKINTETIATFKEKFNEKDLEYFRDDYNEDILKAIDNYKIGEKTPFHSWKSSFRVLYSFIYYGDRKAKTKEALQNIAEIIVKTLDLNGFKYHIVDFDGSQNFGATHCWIALFPDDKLKHTYAIQLFFKIVNDGIKYGIDVGRDLKRKYGSFSSIFEDEDLIEKLRRTESLEDVIAGFKELKDTVIEKNKNIRQFWKFSPGRAAAYWDKMYTEGIMAVDWEIGNLNQYETIEEISEILQKPGNSNESWNLDLFRSASIGDIVIANKGRSVAVGLGIITGNYEYHPERNINQHIRKVDWLINKEVDLGKYTFRADTFAPTLRYADVKSGFLQNDPELKTTFDRIEGELIPIPSRESEESTERNYYWLNLSPRQFNSFEYETGGEQSYTVLNSRGNERHVHQHFLDINPGDQIIGCLASPYKKIVALLETTKSLYKDDTEEDAIAFTIKEFLEKPIDFELLKSNLGLKDSEPIKNIQGSLFSLTEDEFKIIMNTIEASNPSPDKRELEEYPKQEALHESGLSEVTFDNIIKILKDKRQIILQGPPGTGKTYLAKIIARFLSQNEENVESIQFHSSYSYEDFVEGFRPAENGGLSLKDGIFKEICRRATIKRDKTFILLIDEINRGNISKIFGELLFLLEYRREKIRLTYSPEVEFSIPGNLYIIGTMNLADRSLALIDYALRRRFSFINLETDYTLIKKLNPNSELSVEVIIENLKSINDRISETHSLGKDFIIGHSYFLKKIVTKEQFDRLWKHELEPLLMEYFFDDRNQVESLKKIYFTNV